MHVLFMCPHAAAKSVLATALLRDLAEQDGLDITADNAGTDPDPDLNPHAMSALAALGLTFEQPPRDVTLADIEAADVVVTFGCQLDEMPTTPSTWIDWSDAPNASDDVDALVTFIEERIPDLVGRMFIATESDRRLSLDAGQLLSRTLPYDGGRQVTVYKPNAPTEFAVYVADGGWHLAHLALALEAAGIRSTMIIGVHGMPTDEERLDEYVPGFNDERFAAHEAFFVDEVSRVIHDSFKLALPPERAAVWGASLGGELALALGIRRPDVFGTSLVASPGRGYQPPETMPDRLPRVYLVAGSEEPFFAGNARRWYDALRNASADVVMCDREGGHGDPFWVEEFPLMVEWTFGNRDA